MGSQSHRSHQKLPIAHLHRDAAGIAGFTSAMWREAVTKPTHPTDGWAAKENPVPNEAKPNGARSSGAFWEGDRGAAGDISLQTCSLPVPTAEMDRLREETQGGCSAKANGRN